MSWYDRNDPEQWETIVIGYNGNVSTIERWDGDRQYINSLVNHYGTIRHKADGGHKEELEKLISKAEAEESKFCPYCAHYVEHGSDHDEQCIWYKGE